MCTRLLRAVRSRGAGRLARASKHGGAPSDRALTVLRGGLQALRACAVDSSGLVGFDGFRQGIRSLAPGLDDGQLKALFDRHAPFGSGLELGVRVRVRVRVRVKDSWP